MRKLTTSRSGQSIVEYIVLLALIAIILVTVVAGIGQQSRARVARANDALEEAAIASRTSSAASRKPPVAGVAGKPSGDR